MAFSTPKFIGPDGLAREQLIFSTTIPSRFLRGTLDPTTVDVQVRIRDGVFTSDSDLVVFSGTEFIIPNPAVYPNGLELTAGENVIEVKAVSTSGAVSDTASAKVTLIRDSDTGFVPFPPTAVTMERFDKEVKVTVDGLTDARVQSYNFYASRFAGGGVTGYTRINLNPIQDPTIVFRNREIAGQVVDAEIVLNAEGTPIADPLFYKVEIAQVNDADFVPKIEQVEDLTQNTDLAAAIAIRDQQARIQTDANSTFEVPETTTRLRTTFSIEDVQEVAQYSFLHNRRGSPSATPPTIPVAEFAATAQDTDLYYVVTAVYFDVNLGIEAESTFSAEVVGNPLIVTNAIGTFPQVARTEISLDTILAIRRTHPQIAVQAGAVVRDTVIDPTSSEAERVRFLVDFLHRSQSFATLLLIDGIEIDGVSTPVASSSYKTALKQALFLARDEDAQAVVDGSFERLASNFGKRRGPGDRSRGEATFFTTVRPTASIPIPAGTRVLSGSVGYTTTIDATIPIDNLASFFNPVTGRYSITIPIEAEDPGSTGDVGAGQIRSVVGLQGLQVINQAATFGGDNVQTNLSLATEAENALASTDSGRERGYIQTIVGQPGVREAIVVSAGSTLMQRDLDEATGRHFGGKIDIYVRGENLATVTDAFAFTFEIAQDVQFSLLGNPLNLRFRAIDTSLTPANPIIEMLDDPDVGFEFKNATTGAVFDLTGVEIVDYRTIQLNTTIAQPDVDFTDVVLGDYRFRTGDEFILPRQPVREIRSVVGTVSGSLPDESFVLRRLQSPFKEGGSTLASDFLQITGFTNTTGDAVPSGDLIEVDGEVHIPIGEFDELLDFLGTNPLTIKVFNIDRTVEYRGPFDPGGVNDYTIVPGTQTTPWGVRRVPGSDIGSGQQVVIDYKHEENFSVEYVINNVLPITQTTVDKMRHATADVVLKETKKVPVNIAGTVLITSTVRQEDVDQALRSDLATFFDTLTGGTPVRQSDIIGVLERVAGVSFVVTPLTQLVRAEGAPILRDTISTSNVGETERITAWSSNVNSVWIIEEPLTAATINGGGSVDEFRGVFQDDLETVLQLAAPETLGARPGQSFIIGNAGLVIPGLTDNATLEAEFPTASPNEIQAVRVERSQNRVLISTTVDDAPVKHLYAVTYFVGPDNIGVRNIEPGPIEQLELGDLTITFGQDSG